MNRIIWIVLSFLQSFPVLATTIIDVYGDEYNHGQKIIKKYAKEISDVEAVLGKELINISQGKEDKQLVAAFLAKKNALEESIKKEYDYLFAKINTIIYPDDKNTYTTIEVIKKNDPHRLKFISPKTASNVPKKNDLIDKMTEFEKLEVELMLANQLDLNVKCPTYHCVSGYSHPKLKPYLAVFNQGVIKEKNLVLTTLNNDPNPERRASAAFLVGHFKNPKEIIATLLPHVNDEDDLVRNNVVRVLGLTIEKSKLTNVNPLPFIQLLDSPYTTDRNKALLVLFMLAKSEQARMPILQHGGLKLLSLLQLKQPNNHGMAYKILQKISHKQFADSDLTAWQSWIKAHQK